ncbi:MAG: hypothetical protein ACXWMB_05480 [Candidatus Limnocylindria bacterium]
MTTDLSPTAELLQKTGGRKRPRAALVALALAGVLVVGGGGFALGRVTAPSPTFAGFRGGNGGNGGNGFPGLGGGANGPGGGGFRGGGLEGTVESIGGDTMTLKTANGSTITVTLSSTTTYAKEVGGQASDITQGATVRIGVNFAAGAPAGASVPATSVTLITP